MRRLLGLLRDGWLVAGITLALMFSLEGLYRLQLAVKNGLRPTAMPIDSPNHPYHGQAWFLDFRDALLKRAYTVDPYRGFWGKPQASRYMNVDSAGRRRTVQPPPSAGARPILLFGGSAMWGLTARDSMTIGSRIAATLARRGVTGLYVVNDAQPAFVSTQEAATFQGDLANGVQPAAVIFLDGYNDVQSAIQNGTVGRTYTEGEAQRLIDLGRRQFWADVGGLWRHSALVARLLEMRHAPAQPAVKADALCPPVAQYYAQLMRAQIAVARERGFPILIFLQPHNASTHKRLTAWEAALPRDPRLDVCDDSIASAMAAFAGREFFDLRRLFDLDTQTVFVDFRSHVTEEGNERIAEVMADRLLPLIGPHVRNNQRAPTTGPDRGR